MKLMSIEQYSKLTKASVLRRIMKGLKKLPKTKLVKLLYEIEKRRLPTITITGSATRKGMPRLAVKRSKRPRRLVRAISRRSRPKRRKSGKMSFAEKKKFLARLNKGRRKKGLKVLRAKRR